MDGDTSNPLYPPSGREAGLQSIAGLVLITRSPKTPRDSATGLDYAMNRYYSSGWGRFGTPDPYRASGRRSDPQSWNRYGYVVGDPVNLLDSSGLDAGAFDETGDGGVDGGYCELWNFVPNGNDDVGSWDCLIHPSQGQGGDGRAISTYGSGGAVHVKKYSGSGKQQDKIESVLQKIEDALATDTNCSGWLKGGADYIAALISGNLFGHADFNQNTTAAFVGNNNFDGSSAGVPVGYTLTVNNNGAFFNGVVLGPSGQVYLLVVGALGYQGGSLAAPATILIHELGHLLDAEGFKSDQKSQSNGAANDKLVDKNCGNLISGLK